MPAPSASTRYELCEPVAPRRWGLKAVAALGLALLTRDDSGAAAYYGGLRWRVRDRETGDYVYEITTSLAGLDAQEARTSISRDLDAMTVHDFEREYGIDRHWDR